MNRCLVAMEMQSLNGNGVMDFKEAPPLAEVSIILFSIMCRPMQKTKILPVLLHFEQILHITTGQSFHV